MDGGPALRLHELAIGFPVGNGWRRVVDTVSLEVVEGERVGLVGESGSGKSLTALAALGLVASPGAILGGSVHVFGVNVLTAGDRELAALRGGTVGLALQEPSTALNPVFGIGWQLAETIRFHRRLERRQAKVEAGRLLSELGFEDPGEVLPAYAHQLSGGQVQRVMIALALAGSPRLLIADEPTTGLDVTSQAHVREVLDRLTREKNMALLLISHDLAVVAGLTTRTAVMYAGEIVEDAPTALLLARPLHSYTRQLLDAHPRRWRAGEVPASSPAATQRPATGCRFVSRCPLAVAGCHATHPSLLDAGERSVRCPIVIDNQPGPSPGHRG